MACISCGRGFHDECELGCDSCHKETDEKLIKSVATVGRSRGQPLKNPEDVTDKFSTGRKRAAVYWPLFFDKPCEWQGKKNCGGGTPITGCIDGLQEARHHGPVKQVLRNEPGNVHRICTLCHNRWHTLNDPIYDENEWDKTEHKPEDADELELLANQAWWKLRPVIKIKEYAHE